ncbi:Hypothetical protein DEACI_1418 [Acididesulfobacillus acetoxydans]|uniref:Uncharacterized protein n=1 Tax=Acididesulfobacillus acetoxydans TaxID=1561005 RepID=A0A8S0Y2G2_9FIRM|nr:hypothetical protein [Acididesulfobacillus acetoxydans]CAA7600765.1 Hypothetical protein DEACI_1418 [Acididesulfobacillus acetoxydans]CEJ08973.1 Hypothetical protein DEACI_3455 [Acididesulfobacillus acetoxydans]
MPEPSRPYRGNDNDLEGELERFFITTGFYDLLPLAIEMAKGLGYDPSEMIEAICKVNDKFCQYPPTRNRTVWFRKVFVEKLREARGDILTFRARMSYYGK